MSPAVQGVVVGCWLITAHKSGDGTGIGIIGATNPGDVELHCNSYVHATAHGWCGRRPHQAGQPLSDGWRRDAWQRAGGWETGDVAAMRIDCRAGTPKLKHRRHGCAFDMQMSRTERSWNPCLEAHETTAVPDVAMSSTLGWRVNSTRHPHPPAIPCLPGWDPERGGAGPCLDHRTGTGPYPSCKVVAPDRGHPQAKKESESPGNRAVCRVSHTDFFDGPTFNLNFRFGRGRRPRTVRACLHGTQKSSERCTVSAVHFPVV